MSTGAVFVATNERKENKVLMYFRQETGRLMFFDAFSTGGKGSGGNTESPDSLGSQNSLILSEDSKLLFVVNNWSHDISMFKVFPNRLELAANSPSPSRGKYPVSLAIHNRTLYVLNIGDGLDQSSNIIGFRIIDSGLEEIQNSQKIVPSTPRRTAEYPQNVDLNETPSQIQFTPDGKFLVLTIKGNRLESTPSDIDTSNKILLYPVQEQSNGDLTLGEPVVNPARARPFGFTFYNANDTLFIFVCEILPIAQRFLRDGTQEKSAVYVYEVPNNGNLNTPQHMYPTLKPKCWTGNPKPCPTCIYVVATNFTADNSLTTYRIESNGSLSVLYDQCVNGSTYLPDTEECQGDNNYPMELAFSNDSRFLYVTLPGSGQIVVWEQDQNNGSLNQIQIISGFPSKSDGGSIAGLAAY